ncbi:DEAD-like helicase N superfamily domain protein [Mollivirus kamchatka]|nr:DEAD-like helicase N superfamily domain protein [Mollivirus kamchatka]
MDAVRSKRSRSIAVTEESPDVTAQVRKRVARASVLHVHAEEPAEQSNPRQEPDPHTMPGRPKRKATVLSVQVGGGGEGAATNEHLAAMPKQKRQATLAVIDLDPEDHAEAVPVRKRKATLALAIGDVPDQPVKRPRVPKTTTLLQSPSSSSSTQPQQRHGQKRPRTRKAEPIFVAPSKTRCRGRQQDADGPEVDTSRGYQGPSRFRSADATADAIVSNWQDIAHADVLRSDDDSIFSAIGGSVDLGEDLDNDDDDGYNHKQDVYGGRNKGAGKATSKKRKVSAGPRQQRLSSFVSSGMSMVTGAGIYEPPAEELKAAKARKKGKEKAEDPEGEEEEEVKEAAPAITLHAMHPPHPITEEGCILGFGYAIPKAGVTAEAFKKHREWLTLYKPLPPVMHGKSYGGRKPKPKKREFFWEDKHYFYVPRYYGLCRLGPPTVDLTTPGEPMRDEARFIGTLSVIQAQAMKAMLGHLRRSYAGVGSSRLKPMPESSDHVPTVGAGIFKAACGVGKTPWSVALAMMVGVKTFVTVYKEEDLESMVETFNKWAPGARVGIIQGSRFEVEDKDVVVAMMPTLVIHHKNGKYTQDTFASFGMWIADEMHHVASEGASRLHHVIRCRYMIGLTATPRRDDNMAPSLFWHFGPIVYDIPSHYEGPKESIIVRYTGGSPDLAMEQSPTHRKTQLCADERRNMLIARIAARAWFLPDPLPIRRRIMIVSRRKAQLATVRDMLVPLLWHNLPPLPLDGTTRSVLSTEHVTRIVRRTPGKAAYTTEVSIGRLVGGMKKPDRDEVRACNFLVCSTALVIDNFNHVDLDTLIYGDPIKDSEQCNGRLLRQNPNKNVPRIYWICDEYGDLSTYCTRLQLQHYRKFDWEVSQTITDGLDYGRRRVPKPSENDDPRSNR